MSFMGLVNTKWKELADVSARSVVTKVMARSEARKPQSNYDSLANNTNSANYADGSKALRFDDEDNGFAYYKSGALAAVVTKVNSYQKKYFFYHDSAGGAPGELLCFVNELAEGFALEAPAKRAADKATARKRLIWDGDRGTLVEMLPTTANVLFKWRWDPKALNAGEAPKSTLHIQLNRELECKFLSREIITVKFQCDGIHKEFECGLHLRRIDTYLDKGKCKMDSTGKIQPIVDRTVHPTLRDRQRQQQSKLSLLRATLHPSSSAIEHGGISEVMAGLEDFFQVYEERIANQTFTSTAMTGNWRERALEQTKREIPTVAPTGQEVGTKKKYALSLVEDKPRAGKRWTRPDGKAMNNLEVHFDLMAKNPVLPRPAVLQNASGRYSKEAKVEGPRVVIRKLRAIPGARFDKFIQDEVMPSQLVVVACLRKDDTTCRRAEQFLEVLHGKLMTAANNAEGEHRAAGVDGAVAVADKESPYVLVKFEMSESNFMKRRFNIQTLPMYLMFFAGKLVFGGSLGGAPIPLTTGRENPPLLLVENSFKDQMLIERMMKKMSLEWDLALSPETTQHHCRVRRPHGGHGVVMLSASLPLAELKSMVALMRTRSAGGGSKVAPLVVVLLKPGTVPFSSRPIYNEKGSKMSKPGSRRRQRQAAGPVACLKTRLVLRPSDQHLFGAHLAIQKPIAPATISALLARWRRQDFDLSSQQKTSTAHGRPGNGDNAMGPTWMGLSIPSMLEKMAAAREDGRRGRFLPPQTPFGVCLSSSSVKVCGTDLVPTRAPAS